MNLRRATPADAAAIAGVHVASWQVAYKGFFPDAVLDNLSVAERGAAWASRLVNDQHWIWITESDHRVTGFISCCLSRDADLPPPEFAEIAALYIHPAAWQAGRGRALCEAAFTALRTTPAQTVAVWVLAGNVRARHFYERLGFATDDARKDVTMYGVTLPEVRYRLNLR